MRPVRKERDVGSRGVDDALARPDSARKRRRNSPSTHLSSSGRTQVPTARREPHRLSTSRACTKHETAQNPTEQPARATGDLPPNRRASWRLKLVRASAPQRAAKLAAKAGPEPNVPAPKSDAPARGKCRRARQENKRAEKSGKKPPKKETAAYARKKVRDENCKPSNRLGFGGRNIRHAREWRQIALRNNERRQIMSGEITKTCESVIARQWPRAILDS